MTKKNLTIIHRFMHAPLIVEHFLYNDKILKLCYVIINWTILSKDNFTSFTSQLLF